MKLINTKDIKNMLESGLAGFDDFFDSKEIESGPCREILIDTDLGDIVLLVDSEEIMRQSLARLGFEKSVPSEYIYTLLALWRSGRMSELQAQLGIPN